MAKIDFQIVTPERKVLEEQIDSLTCPTTSGEITILPGHVPLVSSLAHGELTAKINGQPQYYAVSGGFVEIRPGNKIIILADMAEHVTEIDEQQAELARQRAQEAMRNREKLTEQEFAQLAATVQRNTAKIKLAQRRRAKHGSSSGVLRQ